MKFSIEEFIEQLGQRKEVLIYLDKAPISKKLRVKRIADDFSQSELSEILGISVNTLSDYENGKKISYKHIDAIHDYLYAQWYEDKVLVDRIEQ